MSKRHIVSAGITFITAFFLAILPIISEPSWSYTGKAAFFALVFVGVRAGIKALWEHYGPELQS